MRYRFPIGTLLLALGGACSQSSDGETRARPSELLGEWSLNQVNGHTSKGPIYLTGTRRVLQLSGCGEILATAEGKSQKRIVDAAETTQCADDAVQALRELHVLMRAAPVAQLSENGDLTLLAADGSRAEFIALTPSE